MAKRIVHSATLTLKLPAGIEPGAEFVALRKAGIPVDALGNVQQGFLFVRTSYAGKNQTNIYRWFANEIGLPFKQQRSARRST
ncbi:hypothetical protein J2789_000185 [Variovorax paradoxus]|uniref:hypothetical protein n=1 Tax=Variovorax atrisoli TaxID=3394203 RepID=UPI00119CFE3D|nr:hypothetical protein [Variovorax paradoxus]MDR6517523.1 hypothetical protein [Variovorax paradoxus]